MSKGALFTGPPVTRGLVTASLIVCMIAAGMPARAQDFRSLQDMLLAAIRLNDLATVRSVVASGADVAKRAYKGKTAIDVAVDLGRFDIAEVLISERRRQREAMLALPAPPPPSHPPEPRDAAPTQTAEIVQPSAEAPPEFAPAPPAAVPPLPSLPVAIPPLDVMPRPPVPPALPVVALAAPGVASVTPEQLLAMAQQLTAAAQALASAQGRAAAPAPGAPTPAREAPIEAPIETPVEVAALPTIGPFAPRPGRKPESVGRPAGAEPAAAPMLETVVVTPRRRMSDASADLLGDELAEPAATRLEPRVTSAPPRQPMRTVPPAPAPRSAPAVQPAATQPSPQTSPSAAMRDDERAEPEDSDLAKAIKGIGGFFGIGPEPKRTEMPASVRELRDHSREPPRRRNVPHVPAKRASDYRTELPPPAQTATPSQPVRASAPRGANPFDPETQPQGAVLPLADPLAGDAPEIAPPPREPMVQRTPAPRETTMPAAARAKAEPVARAPDVPPLAAATALAGPTAAFERRPVNRPAPAPKEESSILKSLAAAVGLPGEDPDDGTASGSLGEPGDPEKMLSRKMPVLSLRPPLIDVPLALGTSVATGERQRPHGIAEPDPCIRRSGGAVVFCVVPVDWPKGIEQAFSLTTYLYQGARAIARYDAGRATHYHALFASHQFKEIVRWFTERYGPPTDEWKRSIAPFDQPRQPNPTLVWRARDSRTNLMTILEVRQFDDTRNVFPDMDHGAVRLYKSGAQRVFPVITGIDIMGIDWAARSDHGDGTDPRALANTIRIGR